MGFQFRARKTVRLGPLRLHFTERGFSSFGLQVGWWTWNARTGQHSIDTPGIGSWRSRRRRHSR